MAHKSKIEIKESMEELKRIYLSTKNDRIRLKLKSIFLLKENKFDKQEKIAIYLSISHATLKRWLKEYNEYGISFLLTLKKKGTPKRIIDEDIQKALHKKIYEEISPFSGYGKVQKWLLEEYGIVIKYATLRSYLIKHFKTKIKTTKNSKYLKGSKKVSAI